MATEVEANPFRPGGELSKEAEDILKNSTILRDTVIINDPSLRRPNGTTTGTNTSVSDSPIKPTHLGDVHASPKKKATNGPTPVDGSNLSPSKPITCEVTASHVPPVEASMPYGEPQVEHVKIKPGRRPAKCCTLV